MRMRKIILIPGFRGKKSDFFLINLFLKDKFNLIYFKYETNLKSEIGELAKQLKRFIDKLNLNKNEKVGIIAISAGGIIADYYLKFVDNKKVEKVISVCSPFKGTYYANFFSRKRKGMFQLRKNSSLIKKLTNKKFKKIKQESMWCYFDFIVPGKSAKYLNSKKTLFFIHPFVNFWPPVVKEIKRFMEN